MGFGAHRVAGGGRRSRRLVLGYPPLQRAVSTPFGALRRMGLVRPHAADDGQPLTLLSQLQLRFSLGLIHTFVWALPGWAAEIASPINA
jgi:hypothetical protein